MSRTTSLRHHLPSAAARLGPIVAVAVTLAFPLGVASQGVVSPELEEGYYAWQAGEYVTALEEYLRVLNGPRGEDLLEEIALLTGELYRVDEIAPDGGSITFGPGSRYISYEVDGADGGTLVTVVDVSGEIREVASIEGGPVRISPSGEIAYFAVRPSSALEDAREAEEQARASGDRGAISRARAQIEWLEAQARELRVRDLASGNERVLDLGDLIPAGLAWTPDGAGLLVVAGEAAVTGARTGNGIYLVPAAGGAPRELAGGEGFRDEPRMVPGGRYLLYESTLRNPIPQPPEAGGGSAFGGRGGRGGGSGIGLVDLETSRSWSFDGEDPTVSADGSRLAFLRSQGGLDVIHAVRLDPAVLSGAEVSTVEAVSSEVDLDNPALSPDGSLVAYQKRPRDDWEIFVASADGGEERPVTNEIQHDLYPQWVDSRIVLAAKGEGRHRRSFLYDVEAGSTIKLFHNNTVRTIAPEYEWVVSPDGTKVLIVSERDGDTVSPERAVYLVDLTRRVTRDEVRRRLEGNLAAERDLRAKGDAIFAPIADSVAALVGQVSTARIYDYAKSVYDFGIKNIAAPGNRDAIEYYERTLRSWGYDPELQWFEPRPGIRTANIIARLPGTVDPDLVYVVSSHFDSAPRSPGADDNSSGSTALLEAARVLRDHPQAATIEFAWFTGEESGLLGSREYVRRAVADGKRIVGALNNDMVGFANDFRLDNTIRYSNPGIRDVQHAAAFLFTDLILYDAVYYKSTDAAAYYEAYGDIVGGIGSYPVLGSPYYHQSTDRIETINHQLVAEVSKTTVGTLMLLASSPSRLTGQEIASAQGGSLTVRWNEAPESEIREYRVRYTTTSGEEREIATENTRVQLSNVAPGTRVGVRAVNEEGMAGWDWAWVEVPER